MQLLLFQLRLGRETFVHVHSYVRLQDRVLCAYVRFIMVSNENLVDPLCPLLATHVFAPLAERVPEEQTAGVWAVYGTTCRSAAHLVCCVHVLLLYRTIK